jgi:hypothetical protein
MADVTVAKFLNELWVHLASEGTSSRDLVAIEFDSARGDVDVLTQSGVHAEDYPDLLSILRNIGRTCTQDRIAMQQLRRISFADDEVNLELVSRSGVQQVIYAYPIEGEGSP